MCSNLKQVQDYILSIEEEKLKAQLKAIRKLKSKEAEKEIPLVVKSKSMSQLAMAQNILSKSDTPMHISEIIKRIKKVYNKDVDRESIVSSLAKKVLKNDMFCRTDKNTFTLIKGGE